MKLLITVSYYSPHISGLTNCVKNLAELLAKDGESVTVMTTQHKKTLPMKEAISGVTVLRVPYLLKISKGFFMPTFLQVVWRSVAKADTVFITLPQLEGFLVAMIAKMQQKKVICLYACDVTLDGGVVSKLIEHVLRFANNLSLLFADKIVILTDDFRSQLTSADKYADKIVPIYPAIVTPVIFKSYQEKMRHLLPRKKYVIGFLGRIAAEKGIEYLFGAIPVLQKKLGNDFQIVLAGPSAIVGEETYQKKIAGLIEKYKEHVVSIGELSDAELGAFYSTLDVLVIPSVNSTEAFGMVQVEAMLCGIPAVVTDLPGVRVCVNVTGMGKVVKKKNTVDLAEGIAIVLKHKKAFVKDTKEIREIFSNKKILQEYKKVFTAS